MLYLIMLAILVLIIWNDHRMNGRSAEASKPELPSTHPSAPVGGGNQRRCPYCAELILKEAKKCKHCGEWLQHLPGVRESPTPLSDTNSVYESSAGVLNSAVHTDEQISGEPIVCKGMHRILRVFPDRVEISPRRDGFMNSIGAVFESSQRMVPYSQIQSVRLVEPGADTRSKTVVGTLSLTGGLNMEGLTALAFRGGVLQICLSGVRSIAPDHTNAFEIENDDPYAIIFEKEDADSFTDAFRFIQQRVTSR